MTSLRERQQVRSYSPKPPKGGERFKWYGPGLIWMTASVGSGAVLFTPRIGSRYGYEFLWLVPIVVFLMWVMIREVGWYTIVTGKTIMDGYGSGQALNEQITGEGWPAKDERNARLKECVDIMRALWE